MGSQRVGHDWATNTHTHWLCYNTASVYVLGFWPQGIWDPNSLSKDWTHISCTGRQSLFFIVIIYLLLAVLVLRCGVGFSLVAASGGHSPAELCGFSLGGFCCCREQGYGHRDPQYLWYPGLVAPSYVGSSQTRDRTQVSCIGRWILYHWATREAQKAVLDTEMPGESPRSSTSVDWFISLIQSHSWDLIKILWSAAYIINSSNLFQVLGRKYAFPLTSWYLKCVSPFVVFSFLLWDFFRVMWGHTMIWQFGLCSHYITAGFKWMQKGTH